MTSCKNPSHREKEVKWREEYASEKDKRVKHWLALAFRSWTVQRWGWLCIFILTVFNFCSSAQVVKRIILFLAWVLIGTMHTIWRIFPLLKVPNDVAMKLSNFELANDDYSIEVMWCQSVWFISASLSTPFHPALTTEKNNPLALIWGMEMDTVKMKNLSCDSCSFSSIGSVFQTSFFPCEYCSPPQQVCQQQCSPSEISLFLSSLCAYCASMKWPAASFIFHHHHQPVSY